MAHGQGGAEIRTDGICPTLTCNHEAPISVHGTQDPDTCVEPAHTLGRNQGQENAVLVKYNAIKDRDQRVIFAANNWDGLSCGLAEPAPAMTQYGIAVAPTIALQTDVTPKASIELAFTLKLPSSSGGGQPAAAMTPDMMVRRLTPVECERLQGFPDNWTRIPVKKYAAKKVSKLRPEDMWELIDGEWWLMAADSPRYKALGNSMAVPCMRWIGRRLAAELERLDKRKGA